MYDRAVAATFACSLAVDSKQSVIANVAASLGQLASMRRSVAFHRTKAHAGHPFTEMVDSLAEFMAWTPRAWLTVDLGMAGWVSEYGCYTTHLQYLVALPEHVRYAYPLISEDGRSICVHDCVGVRWGLPSHVVAQALCRDGEPSGVTACSLPIRIYTYNPGTLTTEAAFVHYERQFKDDPPLLAGYQETRRR